MESDQLPTPSSCCPGLDYASHTSAQASLGCLLAPTPLEKNLIGTAGIAPESSDQVHTQSLWRDTKHFSLTAAPRNSIWASPPSHTTLPVTTHSFLSRAAWGWLGEWRVGLRGGRSDKSHFQARVWGVEKGEVGTEGSWGEVKARKIWAELGEGVKNITFASKCMLEGGPHSESRTPCLGGLRAWLLGTGLWRSGHS